MNIRNIKPEEFAKEYGIELTNQQSEAVGIVEGPCLVLAVPGSGKTTALVTRIGYMIYGKDISPDSILVMTYTVSASRDMKRRYSEIFGNEYADRIKFATINSICAGIIRMYSSSSFQLAENGRHYLRKACVDVTGEYPTEYELKQVQTKVTYIKNMMLTEVQIEEEVQDEEGIIKCIPEIYRKYSQMLLQLKLMDYDDQMVYARRILKKHPKILDYYRKKYKYIMVDEAQDTSKIQHEIIRMLTGEKGNIFMVGDEDQSIYGFRAAYPDGMMDFQKIYQKGKILRLERNFRSTPQIVEATERLIAHNCNRYEKKMFSKRMPGAGVVKTVCSREEQYNRIIKLGKENPKKQFALLYRNNDSAVPLIYHLEKAGIRCSWKEKEHSFFGHPSVLYALDVLMMLSKPDSLENVDIFMDIYYKMGMGLRKEEVLMIAEICRSRSYGNVLEASQSLTALSDKKRSRIRKVTAELVKGAELGAGACLEAIEKNCNYYKDYEHFFILKNIAEKKENISDYLCKLQNLRLHMAEQSAEDMEAQMILSTVHGSKGLEYDNVVMVDTLSGIYQMDVWHNEGKSLAQKEEDRRIFYVGCTRAKNYLEVIDCENAPFIRELFLTGYKPLRSDGKRIGNTRMEKYVPINSNKLKKSNSTENSYNLKTGIKITHRIFGNGTIKAVDDDVMDVDFSGTLKRLNIGVCMKKGAIKL